MRGDYLLPVVAPPSIDRESVWAGRGDDMDQMLEEMAFENDSRRCCLGQFLRVLFVLFLAVFGSVVTIWILQHP